MSEAVREAVKAAIEQVRCAGNPMWEADEAFTREFVAENIADAALTAIAKAGFAVVPREATPEILKAVEDDIRMVTGFSGSDDLARAAWNSAMTQHFTLRVVK